MSNIQTTQINGNIWKLGKSGNIDFCGNFLKLREKEPKTAALLFGHEQQEGYECEDSEYRYKIYHSQYGYSAGRRKKPVFIPESQPPLTIKTETKKVAIPDMIRNIEDQHQKPMEDTDSLSFSPNEIKILKEFAAAINELIRARQYD
jgi:hypothetical protein